MLPRRPLTAVSIVVLALLNSGCDKPTAEPAARAATAGAPSVARVATVTPERTTIRRTSEQPGQVEAVEVTPIHAKLAGYVRLVAVDIGDHVKKGQVLAEL